MATTYEYLVSEFPNNKADLTRLTREIRESAISTSSLSHINYEPNNRVWIVFEGDLDSADQTALDMLVANHSGEALVYQQGTFVTSDGESVTSSEEYVSKLVLQPGPLRYGKYKILFYCEVSNTNTSGITQVRVCDRAGTFFANPSVESEDKDDWVPFCGFTEVNVDENYSLNQVCLSYRRQKKGSAKIRLAKLQVSLMENL